MTDRSIEFATAILLETLLRASEHKKLKISDVRGVAEDGRPCIELVLADAARLVITVVRAEPV